MTEVAAETLARQLLGEGKKLAEIVDATGLEPREVNSLAKQMLEAGALRSVPTGSRATAPAPKPKAADGLQELADGIQTHAQRRGIPKGARSRLTKAALAVEEAARIIAADAGKAAKRAELERLQEQVKALKAEINGTTTGRPAGPSMREVRAWAVANGYDVPPKGMLRRDIVDAYTQAVAS